MTHSTTTVCVLDRGKHPSPATVGHLCAHHATELAALLDPDEHGQVWGKPGEPRRRPSIPALHGLLDPGPVTGEKLGGGVFRSTPPGDLRVMAHCDARSRIDPTGPDDDPAPPMPVLATLTAVVRGLDARDVHGHPAPRPAPTVAAHAAWLHARLDLLAATDRTPDAWRDLHRLHRQLCDAAGDPVMRPLGPCRRPVDDDGRPDDDGPWSCGRPLYLPEQAPRGMDEPVVLPHITCRACRHVYSPAEIVALGRQRAAARAGREAS